MEKTLDHAMQSNPLPLILNPAPPLILNVPKILQHTRGVPTLRGGGEFNIRGRG